MHNQLKKDNIARSLEVKQAFANIYAKKHTQHFSFLITNTPEKTAICVIIAKKNVKKAVQRNLCRRIVKEFFRHNKFFFHNKTLLVLAKSSVNNSKKEDLWISIQNFLEYLKK